MREMRDYRSWLTAGIFLLVVACAPPIPEEAAATPTPTPPSIVLTPTERPIASRTPLPTASPLPVETITPEPSATPELPNLPSGWKSVGSRNIGLQLGVPDSWVDLDELSSTTAVGPTSPGPYNLLLADSDETLHALLDGRSIGQGAFIIGLSTKSLVRPELTRDNAPATLTAILEAPDNETAAVGAITPLNTAGVSGAYVDVNRDPIGILTHLDNDLTFRLAVFVQPTSQVPIVLLLATTASGWTSHSETFNEMVGTVVIHEVDVVTILGALTSNQIVTGHLLKGVTDVWMFHAENGRYATINLIPLNPSLDLTLTLVNASGRVMETMDHGYAGDKEVLTDMILYQDGIYFVEVKDFFDEVGPYELEVILTNEPQYGGGGRFTFGDQVTSYLPPNAEHTWAFTGMAGQVITLILSPLNQQLDVVLRLKGPDERELIGLDEGFSGDAEVLVGYELLITGEYTVLVNGFAGHDGMYTLSLDEGGESTANFWEAGDLIYGDIKREVLREDEAHAWYFDGRAGDEVTIVVTPLNERLDMDVWLLDPNIHKLVMKDEFLSGLKETIEFTLPADGQFVVLVREFFGEAGAYEISLTADGSNFVEHMGALTYNQAVTGSLLPGKRAVWSFSGRRGDVININLEPLTETSDLVIILQNPEGETVLTIDDTLEGIAERLYAYVLATTGEWHIIVQEFFDDGAEYRLTVTR